MRIFFIYLVGLSSLGTTFSPTKPHEFRPGKDYALFFAVNEYESMADLKNPIQNSRDIALELKEEYGFIPEVVENPTLDKIEEKLEEYQRKFSGGLYPQDGQLLLFFTGHGMTDGPNGYFMPADAEEDRAYRTGFEYDHWRAKINEIACKHILVVIDACYSISFDAGWQSKPDRVFGPPGSKEKDQVLLDHQTYRTRRYFTSDAEKSQTPDRSTLAYQFLKALRTHQTNTGYLTADELFSNYLRKASPTPGSGKFGDNEPAARFLFYKQNTNQISEEEQRIWDVAVRKNSRDSYEIYLSLYPKGHFTQIAKRRIPMLPQNWVTGKGERWQLGVDSSSYVPDNMILISGGTFQMGDQFGDGSDDEKPVHSVTVSDFYLSRTELTFAEYDRFCEATGRELPGDQGWARGQRPVINVSWLDAVAYCNWWSEQSGYTPVYRISGDKVTANWNANGYRLPTEAEWEYAARSGGKKHRFGNGQNTIRPTEANFNASAGFKTDYYVAGEYREKTVLVGSFSANDLGLADMSGNVYEWCWDWFDSGYYRNFSSSNPRGPDSGSNRVFRGGGWSNNPDYCRAANRLSGRPIFRISFVGFRLARSF